MEYNNGVMVFENKNFKSVSGTIHQITENGTSTVTFTAMDLSTMSPFFISVMGKPQSTDKATLEYYCSYGIWPYYKKSPMSGKVKMIGDWNKAEFNGDCIGPLGQGHLIFNFKAVVLIDPSFSLDEIVTRTKRCVGYRTDFFTPESIINYAMFDYLYKEYTCQDYINLFVETDPIPGAIIVGRDGKHCGILDKGWNKFIHSNPIRKLVTITPMSMTDRFFKNGYIIVKRQEIPR